MREPAAGEAEKPMTVATPTNSDTPIATAITRRCFIAPSPGSNRTFDDINAGQPGNVVKDLNRALPVVVHSPNAFDRQAQSPKLPGASNLATGVQGAMQGGAL